MTLQLGLEGMPTRLFACTPSRLTTWLDCPRRYRLTYLDRPAPQKGPPWAHNSVGAAVHLALSRWWAEPLERRTPSAARSLVDRAWTRDGFQDDAQADRFREHAGDMVERYAATLDPTDEPAGVERTVATRSATLAVSGRVDRVDRRGDELVVVDYKTGRHVLTTDDARGSLALALYALACARTLRAACTAVELHHLPTGRVARFDHTEESLARHLSRRRSARRRSRPPRRCGRAVTRSCCSRPGRAAAARGATSPGSAPTDWPRPACRSGRGTGSPPRARGLRDPAGRGPP